MSDAIENAKRLAAARAVDLVRPGMRLGLGTGSTARHFVDLLTRDEIEHLASAFTKVHAALANKQNRPPCQ
jgi:ribose 5-phosphate isomerase A